jgi:hypothetical protein
MDDNNQESPRDSTNPSCSSSIHILRRCSSRVVRLIHVQQDPRKSETQAELRNQRCEPLSGDSDSGTNHLFLSVAKREDSRHVPAHTAHAIRLQLLVVRVLLSFGPAQLGQDLVQIWSCVSGSNRSDKLNGTSDDQCPRSCMPRKALCSSTERWPSCEQRWQFYQELIDRGW